MRLVRILDNYINDKKFSMIYTNGGIDIVNYSEILDFSSSKISIRYNKCIDASLYIFLIYKKIM